ncbi:MAG: amino acid permease [Gammaproteobacteria bacterium]|nr:amino acid permease [Gammaproteobacteria bacterium]
MKIKKFGTFEGVFTPTILTIIGVIVYLRLGWVVGSVGLSGAIIIILLAHVATITTGLSIASLSTNTHRIGAGGFYPLICKSLGLEMGGAIGIPLFFSQALGSSLYIVGFTEIWTNTFTGHDFTTVAVICFVVLLLLSYLGANIAMKIQYVIMAIIIFSFISFFVGISSLVTMPSFQSDFLVEKNFWSIFAIFFPAVTGIGAGAAMSGDLKDPKKSLPLGILSAIATGLIIYFVMAYAYSSMASRDTLKNNFMLMVESSRWPWAVTIGIMGGTISSALGSLIAAPRILMAMGQDKLIPLSRFWAIRSKKGEPRLALIFTGILVLTSLLLWDLNSIASLLTMFFLITYGTINLAVFIEKLVDSPSFRPSFKIPLFVPLLGGIWCIVIMFLINQAFAVVSYLFVAIVYLLEMRRNLKSSWGDVRSGFFNMVAEWASKTAAKLPQGQKNWKPNFMIPIEDPSTYTNQIGFIRDIVFPKGTLRLFSICATGDSIKDKIQKTFSSIFKKKLEKEKEKTKQYSESLQKLATPLQKEGLFVAYRVLETENFLEGFNIVTQIMKGMFFPPNIVFLTISEKKEKIDNLMNMINVAIRAQLGIVLLYLHPKSAFGNKGNINIWLREGSPNLTLSILTAMLIERNWNGNIRLISVIDSLSEEKKRYQHLEKMAELARMPRHTIKQVLIGDFDEQFENPPDGDLNIFGTSHDVNMESIHHLVKISKTSCLFVKESGRESFIA